MDMPSNISRNEDTSYFGHMSILPLNMDDHNDLQALRLRQDSSLKPDVDEPLNQDHDADSNIAIKKYQIENDFTFEMTKKQQTSTFHDQLRLGSPNVSPTLKKNNSVFKDLGNYLDIDTPSVCQGSVYTKSKQEKKVPRRLMRAIGLLVNVKSFYNQLTKNSRIFQKITPEQYNLIGDKASFYSSHLIQSNNQKRRGFMLSLVKKIISELIRTFESIPIIEPHKKLKTIWDFIQGILIILIIFFFSMVIVFRVNPHEYNQYLQLTLILFSIDILLQFNTGIVIKGTVLYQRGEIAKQYLKGHFLMDLIGLIPIIQVNTQILQEDITGNSQKRNIPQIIFQALVIFKCFVLKNIFDRLEQRFGYQKNLENLIDLLKLLFTIGSICHFFALLWFGIGDYEINVLKNKDSWLPFVGITDSDIYTKYIYSFYYVATTMITVGYGDITPQNSVEVTFSVVTMFLTGVVYAYSLNCIGNILENINESHKEFRKDLRTIHNFMADENIKQSLRVKISNYVEYLCKESNNQKKAKQDEIISKLSEKLRNELMNEIKGKFISDIPLFKDIITQQTQNKMLNQMEECLFSPGEVIFQHHDNDDCAIYYVLKGQVKISLEDQVHRTVKLIEKRGCFGEISFLTGNSRIGTATANDFCRIYKIKRNNFYQIIKQNDQDFENFQMLYEAVCLKGNLKFAKLYCYSCKRGDHLAQFCPKTHLIFPKQMLIQKYNKSEPIIERSFSYRHKFKFNSRVICHQIQDALINIHSIPEYQEVIHMIEDLAHLNDSYLELYYADEEQSQYDAVSTNYNLNKKESMQEKLQKQDQRSMNERIASHHSMLDKNDLTPSESDSQDDNDEGDDEYTSPLTSHETTTLEQNSVSEFSSHKKKKNGSKKGSKNKNKNKKQNRFSQNEINENILEESSEESIQDTQTQSISHATKFGNKMVKVPRKYRQDSEISANSVYENDEQHYNIDDQSRRYFKEIEDDYYQAKSGVDAISRNSQHQNKSMKSISHLTQSQLYPQSPQQQYTKRKSLHQEVLEKQQNQFNDNEGYQNFKNILNNMGSPGTPFSGEKHVQSYSVFSNAVPQNQSIIAFNDINFSTNNLEDNAVREKKSNSMSASKKRIDENSSKQVLSGYRKSVSFDPVYFSEIQKGILKKQVSGSINVYSPRSTDDTPGKRQYKHIAQMSSFQKIPSAIKNHAQQYNQSNSQLSGQVQSFKRMSTKNFKRQSTKTQPRPSALSINSQSSNFALVSNNKGIMKRGQDARSQLHDNDMKIIQMNSEKLKEIYENQKNYYLNNDILNPVMYNGSKEENDLTQLIFDSMKNYVYYYPKHNASVVIQKYQQIMNENAKQLKKRATIMGKNIKGRIKRVINTKRSPVNGTGLGQSLIQTQINIQDKNQDMNKSQGIMDKSQKSILYFNTNLQTNLIQTQNKIVTSYDFQSPLASKLVFPQKINIIETPADSDHNAQDAIDEL